MTREEALRFAQAATVVAWDKLTTLFGSGCGERPLVEINARLKTTGGRAFIYNKPGKIDLCYSLLCEFPEHYAENTIPHELAHFVAYRVFGEENHGKPWKYVMAKMGLPTTPYHDMLVQRQIRQIARQEGIAIPKKVHLR